jgi:hypothetical protein
MPAPYLCNVLICLYAYVCAHVCYFHYNNKTDGDNFLTHKGQALRDDAGYDGPVGNDADGDDDNNLNAEMVDRLHFGKSFDLTMSA